MPGAAGHITNEQLHPSARGYWLRSDPIDIGADATLTEFLVGLAPVSTRLVIAEACFIHTLLTASAETATLSLGVKPNAAALVVDNIAADVTTTSAAAIGLRVPFVLASTLATSKTWPGLPIVAANSQIWVTLGEMATLNDGWVVVYVRAWEWCELSP